MIEICCLIVVGLVTWMVAAEGIVGAGQIFLITLISGLVAMNFFEPLAGHLTFLPDAYRDFVALVGSSRSSYSVCARARSIFPRVTFKSSPPWIPLANGDSAARLAI